MSFILGLLGPLMRLGFLILGDNIITKWLACIQFWVDKSAAIEIKAQVASQYASLCSSWEAAKANDPTRAGKP